MNKRLEKKKETIERHSKMAIKVYRIKFQDLSKNKKDYFNRLFVEAKWFYNDVIASNDIFNYNSKVSFSIIKNRINNYEVRNLVYLSAQMKQDLLDKIKYSIKMLSAKKKKGRDKEVGKLKFKSEINSIPLRQYNITYKIIGKNKIQLQCSPFKNGFRCVGLKQIPEEAEICNANLIKKATGIYLYITCYVEKEYIKKEHDSIGLDFGLMNNITDSYGNKYSWSFEETDRLKKLQFKLSKQVKRTNRWYKTLKQIKKEYEKINNKKEDVANKFVNKLKNYKIVAIQDEQISNWHNSNMKGWGRKIQHSILGRIKSKIKMLETSIVIEKNIPTTKECPICKSKNNIGLQTKENIYYECNCGYKELRDVHSAKNILKIALEKLGVDGTFKALTLRSLSL